MAGFSEPDRAHKLPFSFEIIWPAVRCVRVGLSSEGVVRYSAIVEPTYVLENRTEFHLTSEFGGADTRQSVADGKFHIETPQSPGLGLSGLTFLNELNAGFDFRHQHVYSATDIAHSYNNLFDLTLDPATINVPLSVVTTGRNASLPVPGRPGYYATPGGTYITSSGRVINTANGETNDTWSYDYGFFLEDRFTINRQLSLFFGIRGLGSPNSYVYPFGDYRQPGIPHHLFSARLNYQWNCGLGVSFGALLTSPIPLTYGENLVIPTQYELDAGIFYVQKNWEARLDFFDFTNQQNWAAVSASNGQDLVYPELPFRVQGTVRFKF
jgi:hypothetical protein